MPISPSDQEEIDFLISMGVDEQEAQTNVIEHGYDTDLTDEQEWDKEDW